MRPSKSRSRGKGNRRPSGNSLNRVFDSSGPEGKVRGTPQQIIDKYQTLARDATLSNDRVAAENFQQHAEHYVRILGDVQREQDARRESQEGQQQHQQQQHQQQQQQHQQQRRERGGETHDGGVREAGHGGASGSAHPPVEPPRFEKHGEQSSDAPVGVLDLGAPVDSGLVETPENAPKKARGGRRRRSNGDVPNGDGGTPAQPDAAE